MGKEAKYIVKLEGDERQPMQQMVDAGRGSKSARQRARVLLSSGQPPHQEISAASQSRMGQGDFGQNPRNLAELMDTLRGLLR